MSIKIQKELYFGCESQVFLINKGANHFSVALKFFSGGSLDAGPYCILVILNLKVEDIINTF